MMRRTEITGNGKLNCPELSWFENEKIRNWFFSTIIFKSGVCFQGGYLYIRNRKL